MADTYSPLLRQILQEHGGNVNLWGTIFNSGVIDLLEESLAGIIDVDVSDGDVDLSSLNGLSDSSRPMFVRVVGDPASERTITVPTISKLYFFVHALTTETDLYVKTTLSELGKWEVPASVVGFVDAVNNRIRWIGAAGATLGPTLWANFNLVVSNATAGDTTIVCRYSKQGHFVFFEIPPFNVTTSTGVLSSVSLLPASIRPGTAQGWGAVPQVNYPIWIEGGAANVEWAFLAQPTGGCGFVNIGTGAPTAPDTYSLSQRCSFMWSTRGP